MGKGIWQTIVNGEAVGRAMVPPGGALLSTAPLRVCFFDADNSGGQRQFNWLWWTALVSISAEEGVATAAHPENKGVWATSPVCRLR